tara:strand:+ start:27461 stop:27796 length:336 start_codon:yes stop_codon:yes gene_type:complete
MEPHVFEAEKHLRRHGLSYSQNLYGYSERSNAYLNLLTAPSLQASNYRSKFGYYDRLIVTQGTIEFEDGKIKNEVDSLNCRESLSAHPLNADSVRDIAAVAEGSEVDPKGG